MSQIPASGLITLNEIHLEAGGTNETACTINDSDIRGLIGKDAGVAMFFNEWYGASNQFVVSFTQDARSTNLPGAARTQFYEWQTYNSRGTPTSGVSKTSFFGGNAVVGFSFQQVQPNDSSATLTLDANGTVTNDNNAFANVSVNGTSFARSAASYSQASGRTTWVWTYTAATGYGIKSPIVSGTNTLTFTK